MAIDKAELKQTIRFLQRFLPQDTAMSIQYIQEREYNSAHTDLAVLASAHVCISTSERLASVRLPNNRAETHLVDDPQQRSSILISFHVKNSRLDYLAAGKGLEQL